MLTRLLCLLGLTLLATAVRADDKVDAQKAAATASLNKAGLKKLATAETPNLLVVTSLTEAKAKGIAEAAQKVFTFGRTALKLDEKEELWPGKLTVVVLGDNREYASYIRVVTQQRPAGGDWFSINTRGDSPTASILIDDAAKVKDAEMQATVSGVVAAALLNKKAGTNSTTGPLPEWLQLGFGRAMVARAAGGAALADYRTKTKAVVLSKKGKPVSVTDVWGGDKFKDSDLARASLVEYLLYGLDAEKFFGFVQAFKPSEMVMTPTLETALAAAEWKWADLDVGWKVWVSKQK